MEQGAPESTDELVEALVPHRYLHIYRSAPPEPLFVPTPLPPLVAARYTGGGCWNLALALHEQTRLPIELFYRGGKPRHAYVVAGDRTLDAFGWRLLRHARAGSEESVRVSPAALLELLGAITPGGETLVAEVTAEDMRPTARKTGALLLDLVGWVPGQASTHP